MRLSIREKTRRETLDYVARIYCASAEDRYEDFIKIPSKLFWLLAGVNPETNVHKKSNKEVVATLIKANKPDFVPTPEDLKKITNPKPPVEAPKTPQVESSGGIADVIRNKVQEAVKAEISKIDIGSMVAKAISDALK